MRVLARYDGGAEALPTRERLAREIEAEILASGDAQLIRSFFAHSHTPLTRMVAFGSADSETMTKLLDAASRLAGAS
jgi:hypothetical protein